MSGIIEVKNLSFAYADEDGNGDSVLDDISLSVEKGSFCAVLGHNGSGKSTLARHFNAINLPISGKVYVAGFDTAEEENVFEIRSRAGMVFQNPDNQMVAALVEDEVAFAPENLGIEPEEIRRRVDSALAAVGMEKYALKATAALSGGQKQRVAIAGVLAMEPEIIILDEPTAMLDPRGRQEVISAIRSINSKNGTTVILITHYMEEAALADRVIVMDDGRLIMDDTPRNVFAQAEKLKAVGLDVPQVTQMAHELKKAGINIRTDVLTVDELVSEVQRLRTGNK